MVGIAVSVGVSQFPIRRYGNLGPIVLAEAVELLVRFPGDVGGILHHVGAVGFVAAYNV